MARTSGGPPLPCSTAVLDRRVTAPEHPAPGSTVIPRPSGRWRFVPGCPLGLSPRGPRSGPRPCGHQRDWPPRPGRAARRESRCSCVEVGRQTACPSGPPYSSARPRPGRTTKHGPSPRGDGACRAARPRGLFVRPEDAAGAAVIRHFASLPPHSTLSMIECASVPPVNHGAPESAEIPAVLVSRSIPPHSSLILYASIPLDSPRVDTAFPPAAERAVSPRRLAVQAARGLAFRPSCRRAVSPPGTSA